MGKDMFDLDMQVTLVQGTDNTAYSSNLSAIPPCPI